MQPLWRQADSPPAPISPRLFWSYAIISLLCAALVSLVPARLQSRLIATHMLEQDAAISRQFVQTILETADLRDDLSNLSPSSPPRTHAEFFTQTDNTRVDAIFGAFWQRLSRQPDIVRVNIYAPDGMCLWSTQPEEIGVRNLANKKLISALIGELAVNTKRQMWNLSQIEQDRVTPTARMFSETYMPIRDTARKSIVGVVQLYKAPEALFRAIVQNQRWIWGVSSIGGLLLFAVLLGLMRRVIQWLGLLREKKIVTPKPQSLFTFYSILSLLFVSFLIVVPTWPLSGYIASRMLERDATVTMQFVQTLLEDMDTSTYFPVPQVTGTRPTYADYFLQTQPEQINRIFGDFSQRLSPELLDIVRISVYAPDGMRIWDTQPKQVGIRWLGNAKLVRALNGDLAVNRVDLIYNLTHEEQDRITSKKPLFSEMYMPIWNRSRDTVVGVVEVYKSSEILFNTIAQGQWWFWGGTIGLGLLLLGVLLGVMRRAVQVMAQQRERLVASETLSAIGEMMSAIADQLHQPLVTISASAEEILAQKIDPIAAQGQDIRAEVKQLTAWLQGLQAYGQPDGELSTSVELPTVVHEITHHLRPSLAQQNIQLQLDLADALPPIQANPALLQQVFHTVLTNAQEAMPDGGMLCIRASRDWRTGGGWRAAEHRPPPIVDIQISDTGHGMTAEELARVFQPFFTTKQRGLGIGMALAKRVVERKGGSISITSIKDQGTTVTLSLPATLSSPLPGAQ